MKALSLLLALHVCVSTGTQWNSYPESYSKFSYKNWHRGGYNWGQANNPYKVQKLTGGAYSPAFLPPNPYNRLYTQIAAKTLNPVVIGANQGNGFGHPLIYAGNEVLRNNGDQNDLTLNSKRTFGDDVEVKQGVKRVNNFVYVVNKTNTKPLAGLSLTSTYGASGPSQPDLLESNPGRYWLNENNQNDKQSFWFSRKPSWTQETAQVLPSSVVRKPGIYYPDNHDSDWNQLYPSQNECYQLAEVFSELRLLFRSSIIEEIYNLKTLFKIIRLFVVKNNLQYASFGVVVSKIGRILLSGNNILRGDIIKLLEEFKNRELYNFLLEIRWNSRINLQIAVSKLAQLLYRFKQVLIRRHYSEESIRMVINRAVQWSVPIVGYYYEKECKIKTRQYIVQNLEVALNVKLESVEHLGSSDELQTETNIWKQGNLDGLDYVGGAANLGNVENVGLESFLGTSNGLPNLGNQVNVGGPGNQIDRGGLEKLQSLDGLGNPGYPSLVEPLIISKNQET